MHKIAIAVLVLFAGALLAQPAAADFVELFDGKSLKGWDGDDAHWSVEDGAITGRTTAEKPLTKNTFISWKGGKPADFELHLKYKIASGNSGVQYRSKDNGDHVVSGYQADIVADDPDKYSGILYEEKGRGILAERGQKVEVAEDGKKEVVGSVGESADIVKAIKPGEWNEYIITARGNQITQKINGVTTVDATDNDKAK